MSYNSYTSSARRPSRTSRSSLQAAQPARDIYSPSSFSNTFRNSHSGLGYPVTTSPGFQSTYSSPSYSVSSGAPAITTIPIQSVNTNGTSNGYHQPHSQHTNNDNHRCVQ